MQNLVKKSKNKALATLSVFGLSLLITGAVDGVTNLPSIAIFGQQLIFFFILASFLFLLPTGLVSAELCKQYPENSGVFAWSKQAFGGGFAALVVWLQWINTMVWFPTCLTTLVGTAAYLINPNLTQHPLYLVTASLSAFWIMTWVNLKGIKHSANIATWATTIGMVIPMTLIIVLSALWMWQGKPMALHLTKEALLPHLDKTATWASLTAIITSFLGMELAAVHVKKVANAEHLFPKALIYAIIIIMITMGLGSLSVAFVIPHQEIALVSGTIQTFHTLFSGFHVPWLANLLGVMLIFGSLGTMVNWLISPANGLAQAAQSHYLPKTFAKENAHGVPSKILWLQCLVVSVISMAFFLMPSINGSYWLLLDLSTELYVAMYILMFITAIKLLLKAEKIAVIPGGKIGAISMCLLGLSGSLIAFIVGFFPPSNINVGAPWHYTLLFAGGLLLLGSPALLLRHYQKKMKFSKDEVVQVNLF